MAAKAYLVCMVLALALLTMPRVAEAATCSPTQLLTPCALAIVGNAAPSAACCGKLRAHQASCLCRYRMDPNLQGIINSPNGKKIFAACEVPLPSC